MLDVQTLRNDIHNVASKLRERRGFTLDVNAFVLHRVVRDPFFVLT